MIVAGFGFSSRADLDSLRSALAATGAARPALLATAGGKDTHPALAALAAELGLPVRGVDVAGVATETRAPRSLDAHGTGSVAEAAALVAAGPGARLIAARQVSGDRLATCALAIGEDR